MSSASPSPRLAGQIAPVMDGELVDSASVVIVDSSAALPLVKPPVTELVWEKLTVKARASSKKGDEAVLLRDLDGRLSYGLTALMGLSGSGKSTLLNSLACRLDVTTVQEGTLTLNGQAYTNAELKRISGYVMQDDLLNGHLTVQETLQYGADLRLPRDWTAEQRLQRVNEVIEEMGLQGCRHVLIGTSEKKGISGGQKRRVCVALQLLTRPQLLFLDEPTSGLDSVTAYELVSTLSTLMRNSGCTIVASIHQPSSRIFELFTHLIVLKAGRIVYHGRQSEVVDTFTEAGYPCPMYTNPADHILEVVANSPDGGAVEAAVLEACQQNPLLHTTQPNRQRKYADVMGRDEYNQKRLSWQGQTGVLFRRSLQEQWRKRHIHAVSIAQSLLMAILIGTAFLNIGTSQPAVARRQAVLFFCVVNQGMFGALTIINSFPSERSLMLRERASGTYYVSSYFIAKTLAETLWQLSSPLLFSFVVYWLAGFANTAEQFVVFAVFMTLCSLAATSLALMVSALARTIDLSVTVLPLMLEISRLFGGFFLSPAALPRYFSWLDALSYIKYCYVGISLNELKHITYACTNASLQICSGPQQIRALGLDYISIGGCAGCLVAIIIGTRIIAFWAVRQLTT